jgi:uncharacterized membrane protein YsdA (DUF1294 family)
MLYLSIYLAIINALGLLLMLIDKQRARKQAWRIPERILMTVAAIGGSLGTLIGMHLFRHKTKHLKFMLGVPALLVAHIVIAIGLRT